ncbi:MAG: hypothetical protein PF517_14550 [Salinivirgaceae bacterium]|nr:hypothetical protein [Salinivirgaceae bacterium]
MNFKLLILYIIVLLVPQFLFAKKKERSEALTDSTQIVIHRIFVGGNKKTKEKIITRELLIKTGDTIYQEHLDSYLEKSKENLLNTSLFNYITINTIIEGENQVNLYVLVEERWYLWPYLIFEHADRNLSSFFHNADWNRINYGLMLVKNNFRGRGETVKFKVRLGYKEQFQVSYEIPYVDKKRKHGFSTDINWFRQKEIAYQTTNDELTYFKDNRNFVSKRYNSQVTYQYRNRHYLSHKISASYSYNFVKDTILALNKNYFGTNQNKLEYLGISYNLIFDKRNYKHYPLNGYNFDFLISQKGLNLIPNEMQGIWEIQSQYFHYNTLSSRLYSGFGAQGKISSNRKQPYFIEQALGYNTYLRAFEYNVIDGQSFASGRAFLKYAIIPMKIKHIEAWSWSKFNKIHYSLFINTFIDAGYVYDKNPNPLNVLPNNYLASLGIGIDLVAYYDQIIRFEYSINRFGNNSFFIHIGKAF